MTLTIRLRPRPTAVRQVCAECEATRELLRRQGRPTWDPLHAMCHGCYRRARARVATPAPASEPQPARSIAC